MIDIGALLEPLELSALLLLLVFCVCVSAASTGKVKINSSKAKVIKLINNLLTRKLLTIKTFEVLSLVIFIILLKVLKQIKAANKIKPV